MTVFVDSSAWYALADRRDADHERVRELLGAESDQVTSDHVIVETCVLMTRRLGAGIADLFAEATVGGDMAIEVVSRADLDRALEIGRTFRDQGFSIVDRTSFVVMEKLRIDRVVTLDDHFSIYRYGRDRRLAFEVLR